MSENSFLNGLKRLSINRKIVLVGTLVSVISVFLPWYKDIDQFKTGSQFLGITGPLYLTGFAVLIAAGCSLGLILFKIKGREFAKLPLKEAHFHILNSVISLTMILIAASVYFHPKFGINLSQKTTGVGMIMSLVGSGLTILGGFLSLKKKEKIAHLEEHMEPIIDLENQNRTQSDLDLRSNITVEEAMKSHNYNQR